MSSSPPHASANISSVSHKNVDSGEHLSVVKAQLHLGYLDHPDVLKAYNEISPELLDRVVTLSEKQAEHRREMERRTINSINRRSWGGMVSGVITTAIVMIAAYFIASLGHPVAASVIGAVNITALVAAIGQAGKSTQKNLNTASNSVHPTRRP